MIAVTFDYGQTLAELDTGFLSSRVAERGGEVEPGRLDDASAAAWGRYEAAKREGHSGYAAWSAFMRALLEGAGTRFSARGSIAELVDFLWSEQPRRNLWRRPLPGMIALARELSARRVPVGIVSNSEGRLAELLDEMGLSPHFAVVADSGRLGFEKPDRRIFEYAARGLGVRAADLIHVGDAWEADVLGALGVEARAVWFSGSTDGRALPHGVRAARTAEEARAALLALGLDL